MKSFVKSISSGFGKTSLVKSLYLRKFDNSLSAFPHEKIVFLAWKINLKMERVSEKMSDCSWHDGKCHGSIRIIVEKWGWIYWICINAGFGVQTEMCTFFVLSELNNLKDQYW